MSPFAFLKDSWGVELNAKAQEEIEANAESLSKQHIQEYIKDTDIRKFGIVTQLPKDVGRVVGSLPEGKYFAQLSKAVDITQPAKFQEDFEGGKWRLLKMELTDGDQKFQALEYASTKALGVHLPPGTKLLLWSSSQAPLRVQNSHLLLTPDTVEVLGGNVEKLVEGWRASREVETNRLLWRTEGIKKTDKVDAAPPWVDFDPKKAPRATRGGGGDDLIEKERAEWRKAAAGNFGPTPGGAGKGGGKEEGSQRFQVDEFKAEDSHVKSQVSSSAFAQTEKGRKGKSKGSEEGGGQGKRGRGYDDGGEEKRAPVASSTLAAFIKPTKDGKLPDEAINAMSEPSRSATSQWDDDGWGGGWDEGGWGGGGGGGGGGWSSGGWGGGGGGGKGGGGRKGGKGGGGKGGGGKKGGGGGGKRGGKGW